MRPLRQIPVARPVLGEPEVDAARRVVLSGWVTQGPEVAAFEAEFADRVGAAHACAVSNCTTALHLALRAVGVGPGDEVITVSHSYIATANAVRYCGATPVFIDIAADGFNMDPALIEPAISERTRAILCVDQLGMPCDLDAICAIARRHGLPVVEDAACASGSAVLRDGTWQMVGAGPADIACFSFHPRKVITTGDGGMLTTGNPDYDARFRLWRQHGMSVSDTVRHGAREVIYESYPELGYNYRMTDLQAAIGREQLCRLPSIVAERRTLAARYGERLGSVAGLRLPDEPAWARSNWQSYCIGLPAGVDQKRVMQYMLDRGIATRRAVMNAHLEPAYAGRGAYRLGSPLPCSVAAQASAIILPLYPQMTEGDQDAVIETLVEALAEERTEAAA